MAGYTVTAISLEQSGPASSFTVAVSVTDSNGLAVQDLGESNFMVRNITNETHISVAELRSAGGGGFYRLLLKAEPAAKAGEYILALVVTSRHHESGRVPGDIGVGHAMVKVKVI
jgi:hypothetical protein